MECCARRPSWSEQKGRVQQSHCSMRDPTRDLEGEWEISREAKEELGRVQAPGAAAGRGDASLIEAWCCAVLMSDAKAKALTAAAVSAVVASSSLASDPTLLLPHQLSQRRNNRDRNDQRQHRGDHHHHHHHHHHHNRSCHHCRRYC